MKNRFYFIIGILTAVFLMAAMSCAEAADKEMHIGVLSFRPLEQTRRQWQPTADYLNGAVPGVHFSIVPMYYQELDLAINRNEFEFVLTNPEHYVSIRADHGLSAIVTLMPLAEGRPVTVFGGVILTRADRNDIDTLKDLRGKVIASPAEQSLGGYLMQRWSLYKQGIAIGDIARVQFTGMPQDKAVLEVLSGRADAGFVRTGILENMAREGKIHLDQFKVLNRQPANYFPQLLSTDLYPEWPFAAMTNVPDEMVKQVTLALLNIGPQDRAAQQGNYFGFSPPGNYAAIEAMMQRLKVNPERAHEFSFRDVTRKYVFELIGGGLVLLLGMLAMAIYLARTNRHLQHSYHERERLDDELQQANANLEEKVAVRTKELQQSEARFRSMLESSPIAVRIADGGGRRVVFANQRYFELVNADPDSTGTLDPRSYYADPAGYDETVRQLGEGGVITDKLVELVIPVQGIKWALASYFSFRFEGQDAVLGWFYDITGLKQTELALQHSEARFRQMFEHHASPMLLIEPVSGDLVNANQAAAEFYGYSIEQMQAMSISEINALSPQEIAQSRKMAQLQKRNYFIFPHRIASGEVRTVEVHSSPVEVGGRSLLFSIIHDITERSRLEAQMHDLAFYDPLTKLPNRRLLIDRLDKALATCTRNRSHSALMFLDLDHFKVLNDLHGHDVGDQLLVEVASRILHCIREQDSAARFGGDEFVVMLEGLSENLNEAVRQADGVAEKIRVALSQPYLLRRDDDDVISHHCSSSIGVTVFCDHQDSIEQLLKWTDMAMYHAKDAGRNAIRFFDPLMQTAIETRAGLEADLHIALAQQQFRLFYQLQVNADGIPLGAEVLLRWQHPKLGQVSPAQFIPLAEETGLIVPIGEWVLDTVCAQIALWTDRISMCDLVIAVNVSAKQFRLADFVAQVQNAVLSHGIKPALLKLELTESLVLDNVEDTIAKMKALKAFGVSFSMDDFGTGYSSLSYLKRLPLDQIKIDQSFVRDIMTDKTDLVMVKTIVDLGVNFEMDVIAEGVETREQLQLLQQSGCVSFQGYLFSKPVPLNEFEALFK
ncbi:MAG: EAL domain-containing protein [Proteobacteria bacterium]|nr:EAL domain-containing protein [Pseudomonadota bacterium]